MGFYIASIFIGFAGLVQILGALELRSVLQRDERKQLREPDVAGLIVGVFLLLIALVIAAGTFIGSNAT